MSDICPACGAVASEFDSLIRYEPAPNDAQLESDETPTDDLPLVVGLLCNECETVHDAIPKPQESEP